MIFITNEDRLLVLSTAVKAREEELLHYQINIDNYRLAIANINDTYPFGATKEECDAGPMSFSDSEDRHRINAILFRANLEELLIQHELEYDKADMMLKVLLFQLEGVDIKRLYESEVIDK